MQPNPVLNKLGFSDNDRLVIIHTDDIGMCQASVQAYSELFDFGLISSGATMVPSSWFPAVVAYCRQNISTDMGVHLTLTSEWDNYRWSPISTSDKRSGMIDPAGYFYHTSEEAQLSGDPEAVRTELQAQLNRALSAGIVVTHLDTHMLTVAHPKFVKDYIQLALQSKVPFLFPRLDEVSYIKLGLDQDTAAFAASYVKILEEQGIPLVDHTSGLDLDKPHNRLDYAKQTMSNLQSGITHFVIHPSVKTPELTAITPDWHSRVADYLTFMSEELRQHLNKEGIHVIGYRALKELID
ncbi:MAG: hypothetical protein C3F13_10135 [Anaerolineales bacterium]|nr:MAG: hypothetical protein C3F13_10135 [Anaerolineales bacterium]